MKWSCEAGTLRILSIAEPDRPGTKPLADTPCPKQGEGFSIQTGDQRLAVEAYWGQEPATKPWTDLNIEIVTGGSRTRRCPVGATP